MVSARRYRSPLFSASAYWLAAAGLVLDLSMSQVDRGNALQILEMLRGGLGSAAGRCGKKSRGLKAELARLQGVFLQLLHGP